MINTILRTKLRDLNVELKETKQKIGKPVVLYIFKCEICEKTFYGLNSNIVAMNAWNHLQRHAVTHPQALEKITIWYESVEI
ncbi:MAG: hypothetical protein QW550_05605 [Saccharolobus sp.]